MPVLFTQSALDTPSTPLNHARIGYDSAFRRGATVVASTEGTGTPASAVKNELTYESWKPTALPATLTITLPATETVDYIAIAGHTIGTETAGASFEYWDGALWQPIVVVSYDGEGTGGIQSGDDSPIMLLTGGISTDQVRINITGTTIPVISVVYVGSILEMYRPFYGGHAPGRLNRQTTVRPTKSVNGQWLGRSIIRESLEESYSWSNTPMTWFKGNMEPFALAARRYPFFVAWNPKEWPEDIVYAWTSDNMAPSFSQSRNRVSFGFSVEALDDGR